MARSQPPRETEERLVEKFKSRKVDLATVHQHHPPSTIRYPLNHCPNLLRRTGHRPRTRPRPNTWHSVFSQVPVLRARLVYLGNIFGDRHSSGCWKRTITFSRSWATSLLDIWGFTPATTNYFGAGNIDSNLLRPPSVFQSQETRFPIHLFLHSTRWIIRTAARIYPWPQRSSYPQ
jgi:hypothetical protein